MLNKEIRYFFTALMFFTRIPCPSWVDHSEEYLNKSRKYFPLIGWIVGGFAALVYWGLSFLLPIPICVILSMIASVWVTGAFHEDGFADVCDGFGGGWTKEQIMTIMKDSRVGAYGAIGIFLLILLKLFALMELAQLGSWWIVAALLSGHASSRFVASTFVYTHEYVQDTDKSKAKPVASTRLSIWEMVYSFIFVAIPMVMFQHWIFLFALPVSYLTKVYLGAIFHKNIGGYTGDCLGATQQLTEVVFYLSIIVLWKYM